MEINNEKDLQNLIDNKIQEDTMIDYKEAVLMDNSDFVKKLVKIVSAMANSDGGTIIFGMKEKNQFPISIDWIKNENDKKYKEKIDQIINFKIVRRIEGVSVKKVLSNDKEKFVVVVKVEKSENPPHQAHEDGTNRRYYQRQGSITTQMEHYQVEDFFNKRKRPKLNISLEHKSIEFPKYEIVIENIGKFVAEKTYIEIAVPSDFNINNFNKREDFLEVTYFQQTLNDFIYPGLPTIVGTIYHPKKIEFGMLKLNFVLVCKDMELIEGEIFVGYDEMQKVVYGKPKSRPYYQNRSDYIFSKDSPFESTTN